MYEELHQAIKMLASVDDYASSWDKMGFNKLDVPFGQSLAQQSSITNAQAVKAYKQFAKYKGQLLRMGLDWSTIPVPVLEEKPEQKNTIDFKDGKYLVDFKFNYELKDKIKAIPGAMYSGRKTWFVPQDSYEFLKPVAEEYDFVWLIEPVVPIDTKPLRYIDLVDGTFKIRCERNNAINYDLTQIVGRSWNKVDLVWDVPFESAKEVQEFGEKHGFTFADGIKEKIESKILEREESIKASSSEDADFEVEINGTPRPYQRAGAKYLVEKKRTFLADDMGTGKTIQSIMAVKHENAFPTVVICPATVKINWQREIKQWIGATSYIVNGRPTQATIGALTKLIDHGIPKEPNSLLSFIGEEDDRDWVEYQHLGEYQGFLDNPSFVIINFDIVHNWLPVLKKLNFKAIIVDESSYTKNSKTKRTKAIKDLASDIEYRFLLSGTPMLSRPSELISQLQILDRLQEFGGWSYFTKTYCQAYHDGWGYNTNGSANTEQLGEMLRSTCMVRRTKKDVLKELPDKQRSFVYLPLGNRKEYDKAEENIINWIGEQALKDEEFKKSISHLPKAEQARELIAYANSEQEKARRAQHLVEIEKLKTLSAQGKLEAICEWIESFLETGEKLVVFGWHKAIVETIAKRFNAPFITGDTPNNKRQQHVDAFQNDENTKLIVLNIKAGGMGITLTAASNCALVELGWTPGEMHQAEDRIHRIGQKNAANCWYMLGERTIDHDINELLLKKSEVITNIVGGEQLTPDSQSILSDLVERLKSRNRGYE